MLLDDLVKNGILKVGANIPAFILPNTAYLTIMGSNAYGVSSDNSDFDVYGFAIPPLATAFPHTAGAIQGFGPQPERFDQWQQHHMKMNNTEYDVTVYNIIRYFQLLAENNPNMLDSIYTPRRCVIHSTKMAEYVRENRNLFVHKGSFHKFKGYAYSQLAKIRTKQNAANPKRAASIEKFGYDTKYGYHLVRLALECEMLMIEGSMDLERNSQMLISIREGHWSLQDLEKWFAEKETQLETLYNTSKIRYEPDWSQLKTILLNCLEIHYGSLSKIVVKEDRTNDLINEINGVISKYI